MTDAQISSVLGNSQFLDGGSMFGNAPRAVWERWIAPDERDRIPLQCRTMLLEWQDYKVLCETGIGAFFEPKMADRFGVQNADRHMLLENLAKLNLSDKDITHVILSHLHFDHAGGLLPTYQEIVSGHDQLLFSNAKYIVGKEAFARAQNPHFRDKASFIAGMVEKLISSQRLVIIDEQQPEDLFNGRIHYRFSQGHTLGQMHTVFHGSKHKVVFCGDLIPGVPWVHLPITMGYDRFPEMLIDEKQHLYDEAVPENWLFFFTHDPEVAAATVINDGSKYRVEIKKTELIRETI